MTAFPSRPGATRRANHPHWASLLWSLVVLLGIASAACWGVPLAREHGPYGHGFYKYAYIYAGLLLPLYWLASLTLALAPPSIQRPLTLRLLAVLVVVSLGLPVCDIAATVCAVRLGHIWYHGLCFARSQNRPDPELIWQRKPNLSWRGRKTPDCDEVVYRSDENGFRNPRGIRRAEIVVVGDSVTEAGEVAEESTFVHKLGVALGLVAVNLGTSGYGPQQQLAVLRRYGLSYNPRLVVWQVTEWNDVLDAQMYLDRDEPRAHALPPWSALYARHSPVMQLFSTWLPGRRPNLVAFHRSDGRVERQAFWPYRPDPHEQFPQAFAALEETIASAYAICRSRGIAFVVLYVPSHVRVLLPYMEFENEAERHRFCPGGLADRESDLAHAMAHFCAQLGCPLIDMCPPLRQHATIDNRSIYVPNDPHLGSAGHDEVQRVLARYVESHQILR